MGRTSSGRASGVSSGGRQRATGHSRWLALIVLCAATLMIILDGTIVTVALPSIQRDLGFSAAGLEWVMNGYLIAFGGLLLLGGRLGDLASGKRVFLAGLVLFTVASLVCGLSVSQPRQAHQVRQLIGLTGQYASVDETLTGAENLVLIGRLVGEDRKTRTSRGPSIATCTRSILPAPAPSGAVIGGLRFPTVWDTPDRGPAEW